MKLLEKIFSVKNEYCGNNKHKIFTILGIKIKFKCAVNMSEIKTIVKSEIPIIELFFMQFKNEKFNRFDMIVRLLAIENYYNKNDFGWLLYNKIQDLRVGNNYSIVAKSKFIELIKNWEENGYNTESAIEVNSEMGLLDGSHRLALALYHNLKNININILSDNIHPEYGIEWFIENNFSEKEIKYIIERYNKVLLKYNNGQGIIKT